jgi:thiosulfate reductase cytochrome b subunit
VADGAPLLLPGAEAAAARNLQPASEVAYTAAIGLTALADVSGLALYKPVQLAWLVAVMGGFRFVRVWRFLAMCGLMAFIPGHLVMVALHGWSNFASMWTGGRHRTRGVDASPPLRR